MIELQTIETLNCLIERTETPPFYRLTVMRKASSHSDGTGGVAGQSDSNCRSDLGIITNSGHLFSVGFIIAKLQASRKAQFIQRDTAGRIL